MTFEEWLAGIIDRKCINPAKLSKEIGISYKVVYNSLFNKKMRRELRSSELIAICRHIGVNPMDFEEEKGCRKWEGV